MTAEIGILNTKGLALAADSAVTIDGTKVRNNARKLFTLDSQHSIGIMIYGNADLMNVPWEIIITAFRRELGDSLLNKVVDYKDSFFKFIENFSIFSEKRFSNMIVINYAMDLISVLNKQVSLEREMRIQRENELSSRDLQDIFRNALNKTHSHNGNKPVFQLEKNDFLKNLDPKFDNFLSSQFGFPISNELVEEFKNRLYEFVCSNNFSTSQTGVVIAGYGKDEYFPVLQQYAVDGFINGKLKFCLEQDRVIGISNGEFEASLVPFAQQEMVHTIIFGIDPMLDNVRKKQLTELKESIKNYPLVADSQQTDIDKLFASNEDYFQTFKHDNYSEPIIHMLRALSLSELATMAQTMVSLTSFKRKFWGEIETVGGPIDVLVISKGEGPVWIKRKKYFDKDMNEGYFKRRR